MEVKNVTPLLEKSIENALSFYKREDIDIDYIPTIQYLDELYEFDPSVPAVYTKTLEDNSSGKLVEKFIMGFIDPVFEKVGEDKLEEHEKSELIKKAETTYKIITKKYTESEADILVFKPMLEYDTNTIEYHIAHEIWHMIENRKNVATTGFFIKEGTAAYAANRFKGINYRYSDGWNKFISVMEKEVLTNPSTWDKLLFYIGATQMIHEKVKNYEKPLKLLLNPSVRKEIEEEFLKEITPLVFKALERIYNEIHTTRII